MKLTRSNKASFFGSRIDCGETAKPRYNKALSVGRYARTSLRAAEARRYVSIAS